MAAKTTIIGEENSYFNHILFELREEKIQTDRMRFRFNLERAGEIMAYEISKLFPYSSKHVTTPLGELEMNLLDKQPVLVSILRAGVPFHQGFLRIFDHSDNGFISAYRHHTHGNEFIVKVEYTAIPDVNDRPLILVDPMIATGKSIVLSYREIANIYKPSHIIIAGLVASEEGVDYVKRHIPQAYIFAGAVDHELTAKSYIVPGLGDAGDLAYGPK
ncbi:MAG: uracil phosphoribosyltransferase [Bacteroidetes bacterium]|nr:uracil phosphoribosyltransferase [Bacteroidota bacterium]MCB0853669.1 uracil phosphoribosyltransferase [Bacteroidota bacterium]